MDYMIWSRRTDGNACVVDGPEGVNESWELKEGVSWAKKFPKDASFRMSARHKKAVRLMDNVANTSKLVVISGALKKFLDGKAIPRVEYLPVSIINHKGRVASADYFILNTLGSVDCLDLDASEPSYNEIVPSDIDWVEQLVLDPKRIDPSTGIFRIKDFPMIVLVRRDIADEILDHDFTGTLFLELDEYEG